MASVGSGIEHDVVWGRLEQLNPVFFGKVRGAFQNPGAFILTLTSEADTLVLVEGEMVGLLKQHEMRSLAKSVWSWANRFRSAEGRTLRSLHDTVELGPYLVAIPRVDPSSVNQSLISSDPLSGLSSLENHLRAAKQLQSNTSRQAQEEAVKKKWLLRLTACIVEAKLPAVSRIQALPDPASAWSRAFGSRRGGTLKKPSSGLGAVLPVVGASIWYSMAIRPRRYPAVLSRKVRRWDALQDHSNRLHGEYHVTRAGRPSCCRSEALYRFTG